MSTYRESAQFIDELRQHYRRLDGLLVKHKDKLGPIDVWEFNHPVIALRKLLFGGVGDPNPPQDQRAAGAASSMMPRGETVATAASRHGGAASARMGSAGSTPAGAILLRLVEDAPTAPMSVHDPAEDLEVIP